MKKKVIIICVLISLTLFLSGITYSLFNNEASIISSSTLANFVVDAKKTSNIDLELSDLNPGDELIYDFSISNTSEKTNSDVNILYNIKITTMHFIPLDITLYDSNDEVILTCSEENERNLHNELECVTEDVLMPYIENIKDDYKLKLVFPEKYNTTDYSSLVDYINLEINSYQKLD